MSETTNISTETRDDDSSSTASTSNVASSMALTSPETKIDSLSTNSAKPAMKPSMIETFRTCVLSGIRIDKEELKKKLTMPVYLRRAMRDCIRYQDPTAMSRHMCSNDDEDVVSPETPMVAFINTNSGGRHGPVLKERLKQLMSEEQVFDLSDVKPHEFVEYGLGCLETFVSLGDFRAKEARERMRIVVAGGDGTVGWVLGCLSELHKNGRAPVPPVGIIPLGTGNDLSRSFNWGGSFPFVWKSAINRSLSRASTGPITLLDSWRVSLSMPEGTTAETPYSLKPIEKLSLDEGLELGGERPDEVQCYDGVFYNYYSIGMDAQVAYGFHNLRNEKPYLANGPIANKIIYSGYGCTQGWFLTQCSSDPGLRGIRNILRMHVKKFNSSAWENVPVPSSVRAIVALNLHSYGSGRNPWGNLKPEYMERRGFVEAQADDGLLEIFGLKQGWHASFVMVELISAKHIAQASAIRFEIRGGEWQDAYMQMDGEPWKQPLSKKKSTFVEIKREPFQSYMIRGEQN